MKTTYTLKTNTHNKDIKVGDKVYLWDGSSLTHIHIKDDFYIIKAYPNITGSNKKLKAIQATVITTGITDKIVLGAIDWAYTQGIVIQIGKAKFRTASSMVKKEKQDDYMESPYFINTN